MPAAENGQHGEPLRSLVAGQQDQCPATVGVVERPLQGREVATEHVAEPVDHADSVADQVGAMGHQQPQLGHQRGGDLHLLQIAAVPGGLGDDVGITGISLGFTTVGGRHLVHSATWCVLHLLTMSGQQSKEEPGHGARDIDCPDHLIGAL